MAFLDYLRAKNKLVFLDETEDDICRRMFRADQHCKCDECGKYYLEHSYVENCLDYQGNPYLLVLCNGDIVKL